MFEYCLWFFLSRAFMVLVASHLQAIEKVNLNDDDTNMIVTMLTIPLVGELTLLAALIIVVFFYLPRETIFFLSDVLKNRTNKEG
jgi:hypothetical protein